MSVIAVRDNPAERRYKLLIDDEAPGSIVYRAEGNPMTFVHTQGHSEKPDLKSRLDPDAVVA